MHGVHGLERIVFEDFLANLIPDILLGVELRGVGWKVQQPDVVRNRKIAAAMVGSAVENEKDVLSSEPSCQHIEEYLETGRVRCRHDQIHAAAVLGRDRAVQINVFTYQLGGHYRPRSDRRPARSRPIDTPEPGLISEHDAQAATTTRGCPPGFPHSVRKAVFLKAFCAAMLRFG